MTERDGAVCKSENAKTARASLCCYARPIVTRGPPMKVILIAKDSSFDHSSIILVVYTVYFLFSLFWLALMDLLCFGVTFLKKNLSLPMGRLSIKC